jgi:hypothetical protein
MTAFRFRLNAMTAVIVALTVLPTCVVRAADAMASDMYLNAADLKWGDAPPVLPKGAKVAVLYGDPGKPGPFTIRLKVPGGYMIAPHYHSEAEQLTVISGTLFLGSGDTMEKDKAHAVKAGGFHALSEKAHHYAYTKSPTVVEIHSTGPFDINYLNEADDPMKKGAGK